MIIRHIRTLFLVKRNNDGGILIPVLAILVMMTTLMLFFIQDYQIRQHFTKNTTDYYLSRTLEKMTLEELSQQKVIQNQTIDYNIGQVEVKKVAKDSTYNLSIRLNNQYKRSFDRTVIFKE